MINLQSLTILKTYYLKKALAFIKRDFLINISYRADIVFQCLSVIFNVSTFYFVSKLFGNSLIPRLNGYPGGYFPFVLIGIAFSAYFSMALHSFAQNIRHEQITGTLEAMLMTPTKISVIIVSMAIWDFIFNSIITLAYLLLGVLFFKVDLSQMNLLASLIIILLTIISIGSIGIISASFVMVLKKGDPISWLVNAFSGFFGGVFFPVAILPFALQKISYLLPVTYSLSGLRHALLQGWGFRMLIPEIIILLFFCIILLPLSIWVFKLAVNKAKQDGSLVHY